MVNMWRGVVVFVAIASIVTLPSGADADGDCAGGAVRCGDGSCAGGDLVCDGTPDCADGADEALELCRESGRPLFALILLCQQPWSPLHDALCPEVCREWPKYCYYAIGAEHGAPGTCVLPQPSKRGAYSIVDVEPRGRGPADFSLAFACPRGYRLHGEQPRCERGIWTSDFPTCVLAMVPAPSVATAKPNTESISNRHWPEYPRGNSSCVVPESPVNGYYEVNNSSRAGPGQVVSGGATLTLYCHPGYMAVSTSNYCVSGIWIPKVLSKCTRFCTLPTNTGASYMCSGTGDDTIGLRPCPQMVPSGTEVLPQCNPYYYYSQSFPAMRCLDGSWENLATCLPECGLLTPSGEPLVIGGQPTVHSEIPWHAIVYDKSSSRYRQVCGGSLVSTRVVISAAHCYWSLSPYSHQVHPAEDYAVAVGKVYRAWGGPLPRGTQTSVQSSDVRELQVPIGFMGYSTLFQYDIALVMLATPVVFNTFVKPVCLDFHEEFDRLQLRSGKLGKILSWASTDNHESDILSVRSLPYVDLETCIANSGFIFRSFITIDKFCANGTVLSHGDIGAGLSFPAYKNGKRRYYLRGIASITYSQNNLTAFTKVLYHEDFIKRYLVHRDVTYLR